MAQSREVSSSRPARDVASLGLVPRFAARGPVALAASTPAVRAFNAFSMGLCTLSVAASAAWSYVSVGGPIGASPGTGHLRKLCMANVMYAEQQRHYSTPPAPSTARSGAPDRSELDPASSNAGRAHALRADKPHRLTYSLLGPAGAARPAHLLVYPEASQRAASASLGQARPGASRDGDAPSARAAARAGASTSPRARAQPRPIEHRGKLEWSSEGLRYIVGPATRRPWASSELDGLPLGAVAKRQPDSAGVRFLLAPDGHQLKETVGAAGEMHRQHAAGEVEPARSPEHATAAEGAQSTRRASLDVPPQHTRYFLAPDAGGVAPGVSAQAALEAAEAVPRVAALSKSNCADTDAVLQKLAARAPSPRQIFQLLTAVDASLLSPPVLAAALARVCELTPADGAAPGQFAGEACDVMSFAASRVKRRDRAALALLRTLWGLQDETSWSDPRQLLQRLHVLAALPEILPSSGEVATESDRLVSALAKRRRPAAADVWHSPDTRALLEGAVLDERLRFQSRQDLASLVLAGVAACGRWHERGGGASVAEFLCGLRAAQRCGLARSREHVGAVLAFLEGGLPRVTAQVDALSADEVSRCVAGVAEVVVWQGRYTDMRCDAAMAFLKAVVKSRRVQTLEYSADDLVRMTYGLRHLLGVHRVNAWCTDALPFKRPGLDPGVNTHGATVWGRAITVPGLVHLCRHLSNRALDLMHISDDSAQVADTMLRTLASLQIPYGQIVSVLPHFLDELYAAMEEDDGRRFPPRRVAHVVQALGQLGIPFERIKPLVRRCLLHAERTQSDFDLTSCYLLVDGLAKVKAPTGECAPVLHALMDHLASGLVLRPANEQLYANIMSCPPSQLLKFMTALQMLMPSAERWRRVEFEPQQVFLRAALSHLVRERLPQLSHADISRLLDAMARSHLGGSVPRPWRLDASMRTVDGVAASLFGDAPKALPPTHFWTGLERYDAAYTGVAATPPGKGAAPREPPTAAELRADAPMGRLQASSYPAVVLDSAVLSLPNGLRAAAVEASVDAGGAIAEYMQVAVASHQVAQRQRPRSRESARPSSGFDTATNVRLFVPSQLPPVQRGSGAAGDDGGRTTDADKRGAGGAEASGERRLQSFGLRASRPFLAHDAISIAISMANIWPDATPEARDKIGSTVGSLVAMFPPHRHTVSKLAQAFWVLPRCGLPWSGHADFLSAAVKRVHAHIDTLRPRDVSQAMKGLRMMALSPAVLFNPRAESPARAAESHHPTSDPGAAIEQSTSDEQRAALDASTSAFCPSAQQLSDAFPGAALSDVQDFVRDGAQQLAEVAYSGRPGAALEPGGGFALPGVGEGPDGIRLVGLGEACLAAAALCREADVAAVAAVTSATYDALRLQTDGDGRQQRRRAAPPRTLAAVVAGVARVRCAERTHGAHEMLRDDVVYLLDIVGERIATFDADALHVLLRALAAVAPLERVDDLLVKSLEWVAGPGAAVLSASGDTGPQRLLSMLSHVLEGARRSGKRWVQGTGTGRRAPGVIAVDAALTLQLQAVVEDARCAVRQPGEAANSEGEVEAGAGSQRRPIWAPGSWSDAELALLQDYVDRICGTIHLD